MSVKLQDLATELRVDDAELGRALATTGIKVLEGVHRIPDKDASKLRTYILDQRRRTAKQQELIQLPSVLTVRELSEKLTLPIGEIIGVLLKNGLAVTVNEQIDYETAAIVASDLGYQTTESVAATEEGALTPEKLWEILKKEEPSRKEPRPPVVTVMGHIDAGKTSVLDAIREASVAAGEAGGITQAISGYQVRKKGKVITFIDTPGHEAFEFMRKRGASLADIAILVVAADEGVKEQTVTALRHAQEAEIPLIVALNKIDKPEANIERVKRQLADAGVQLEEWGGTTPVATVSAKTGQGLDDLLETILIVHAVHPTSAITDRPALASVVEAHRDPRMGPRATVLVHTGTLRTGNHVAIGKTAGTLRKLSDFAGHPVREAKPGMPVTILGLEGVPEAGDILQVVEERAAARAKVRQVVRSLPQVLAPKSVKLSREEREARRTTRRTKKAEGPTGPRLLPLVVKAESQGSLEAIRDTLTALGTADVAVRLLRADVGSITDSDIRTAEAAEGVVLGFSVPATPLAQKLAETSGVPVQTFSVIYALTEEVRKRLETLLPTIVLRTDLGELHVLKVFFSIRGRQIIGGRLVKGALEKGAQVEAFRGDERVMRGQLQELQVNRVPVDQAAAGQECGLTVTGEGKKIKAGDRVVAFREEARKKSLPAEGNRQQATGGT